MSDILEKTMLDIDHEIEQLKITKNNNAKNYNTNIEKIKKCKIFIEEIQNEISQYKSKIENSEITEELYEQYINELSKLNLQMDENSNLTDIINMYKNTMDKLNKCKYYIEKQKLVIENID